MDVVTHLKPGKYKLITEAGPTAPFFILLLTDLSVSPSCLLATDNKETKHFTPPLYESFPSAKQMPFFLRRLPILYSQQALKLSSV